ncbi:hypothetical protein EVAR_5434_1 [Eumeta japonica]|uniref:Uncharacterized protein n=1 Tax=Eumeta variegata TaxID=151549 RepID=A0A4C1T9N5_EUMVA|nr:hypothetical protein EVAR_5434_1 [Eumeta japonica]
MVKYPVDHSGSAGFDLDHGIFEKGPKLLVSKDKVPCVRGPIEVIERHSERVKVLLDFNSKPEGPDFVYSRTQPPCARDPCTA